MKWQEALNILKECERGLRRVMAEAAGEGDYTSVQRIADLAKTLAALGQEGPGEVSADTEVNSALADRPAAGSRRASPREEYPKFFRRGDELVKIGWSRTVDKEYNHRAPRSVVDAVAAAVRRVGAKRKQFIGGDLLPLEDARNGAAIPDYQAYVALAWMKDLGLVEQHGRRAGYTLTDGKQIDSTIAAAWPELAEWRG